MIHAREAREIMEASTVTRSLRIIERAIEKALYDSPHYANSVDVVIPADTAQDRGEVEAALRATGYHVLWLPGNHIHVRFIGGGVSE